MKVRVVGWVEAGWFPELACGHPWEGYESFGDKTLREAHCEACDVAAAKAKTEERALRGRLTDLRKLREKGLDATIAGLEKRLSDSELCPARDSKGVCCERERGHIGGHACPAALAGHLKP